MDGPNEERSHSSERSEWNEIPAGRGGAGTARTIADRAAQPNHRLGPSL